MADSPTVLRARQLIDDGRFGEAVALLEQHLRSAPDDHVARAWLRLAHYRSGNYVAAEVVYRVLVDEPKPDPRDQYSLGLTMEMQGEIEEAKRWIGAAAAADPTFTQAVADRDRLARTYPAPSPGAPPSAQPSVPGAPPPPLTVLGVPRTPEELKEYTEETRARARADWWTQKWFRYPKPIRAIMMLFPVLVVAVLAWMGWAFYEVITDDSASSEIATIPGGGGGSSGGGGGSSGGGGGESDPGDPAVGKDLFASLGCGSCHTLAGADTNGSVGPNLDESMPDHALVVERVTNGMGVMPAFKDS